MEPVEFVAQGTSFLWTRPIVFPYSQTAKIHQISTLWVIGIKTSMPLLSTNGTSTYALSAMMGISIKMMEVEQEDVLETVQPNRLIVRFALPTLYSLVSHVMRDTNYSHYMEYLPVFPTSTTV